MNVYFLLLSTLFVYAFTIQADENKEREKLQSIFARIYENKIWGKEESLSGDGSRMATTLTVRLLLPSLIKLLNIETLIDVGCGDFNWMKTVPLDVKKYIGVDIVPEVIEKNNKNYANNVRSFICLDAVHEQIPCSDLILCKDVWQHLSFKDISAVVANFKKSGAHYLLTTSYFNISKNIDISSGGFQPVNLLKPPFNFPEPLITFDELFAEPVMLKHRKRLCLWRLADIPNLSIN